MLERPRTEWVRRGHRNASSLTGAAYRLDGSWARVHMTNLSYDGGLILSDDPLEIGETITLIMPKKRQVTAQVRWADGLKHGVEFVAGSATDERRAGVGV